MAFLFSKDLSEREGYCSWCFTFCKHHLIEKAGPLLKLKRAGYQCGQCKKETVICRLPQCPDFARSVPGFREERCYVHRKLIQSWDDHMNIDLLNPTGYCSNCYEQAQQRAITVVPIQHSCTYECMSCHEATVRCKDNCIEGFAIKGSKQCSKCTGDITDWTDAEANKARTCETKTCSWCLTNSRHALRDSSKKEYQCLTCYSVTTPCSSCQDCMAAKSTFGTSCTKCKLLIKGPEKWDALIKKKKFNDDKYEQWEQLINEVQRASEYRTQAFKEGCIRPFLILVLMHPRIRVYVAMCLGIVLTAEDSFLDSHAEAWTILNKHKRGIQARTNKARETINVFGKNVDWYVILYRLMKVYLPQSKWCELPDSTHEACITPGNVDMTTLECTLIAHVVERQSASFSVMALHNFELLKSGPEFASFRAQLQESIYYLPVMDRITELQLLQAFQHAGLHTREVEFTAEEVNESTILADYAGLDVRNTGADQHERRFIQTGYVATKRITTIGAKVGTKTVVSLFLPIVGWALLAHNVGNVVFGDTLDVCAMPVREILLYHALLMARGIQIEDYYLEAESTRIE